MTVQNENLVELDMWQKPKGVRYVLGRVSCLAILYFICMPSYAQIIIPEREFCNTCADKLNLNFDASTFMKNNEYFSPYTEGFTGMGFYLQPTLQYYFGSATKASLGAHLLMYSGLSKFTQVVPIFRIEHQFTDDFAIVMGNIYGNLHHRREEALYRSDYYYQDNVEYGFQFLYTPGWMRSDTWINWEEFIFPGDTIQEVFTIGNTTDIHFATLGDWAFSLPIQFLYRHKGGQINIGNDPVYNFINGASGLTLRYNFSDENYIALEPRILFHTGKDYDERIGNLSHYKNGHAVYYKSSFKIAPFYGMVGYWASRGFIAPHGEYLFLNIAEFKPDFKVDSRRMLTAKIGYRHEIGQKMSFQLGFDGYYDLDLMHFDYSYGLYLMINYDFFLARLRQK